MEKEVMDLLSKKFAEAYGKNIADDDVEGKKIGGTTLYYLNWATAWRIMKEVYPDANYRVLETPDGSPLWNVNGYGMVKCAVSALGVEHVETFPIMDMRNNAMKIETISARSINDSIQRGLTKACARFGVGLPIYEGHFKKKEPEDDRKSDYYGKPKQQEAVNRASSDKLHLIQTLMDTKKVSKDEIEEQCNIVLNSKTMTKEEADKVIDYLDGKEASFGYSIEK